MADGNTGNTLGRVVGRTEAQGQDAQSANPPVKYTLPDEAQTTLDAAQLAPSQLLSSVAGSPATKVAGKALSPAAGLVDAGFSFADGRYVDGSVSLLEAIPVIGQVISVPATILRAANGGTLENFTANYQASLRRERWESPSHDWTPRNDLPPHYFEIQAYRTSQRFANGVDRLLAQRDGGRVVDGQDTGAGPGADTGTK